MALGLGTFSSLGVGENQHGTDTPAHGQGFSRTAASDSEEFFPGLYTGVEKIGTREAASDHVKLSVYTIFLFQPNVLLALNGSGTFRNL